MSDLYFFLFHFPCDMGLGMSESVTLGQLPRRRGTRGAKFQGSRSSWRAEQGAAALRNTLGFILKFLFH